MTLYYDAVHHVVHIKRVKINYNNEQIVAHNKCRVNKYCIVIEFFATQYLC